MYKKKEILNRGLKLIHLSHARLHSILPNDLVAQSGPQVHLGGRGGVGLGRVRCVVARLASGITLEIFQCSKLKVLLMSIQLSLDFACVCVRALVFKSMQHPTMVLHVCVCVCVYVLCVSVCLPFGFSISEHPLSC